MLADFVRVYVAQDRDTGEFIASNCTRVKLLRNAGRSSSREALNEAIANAVFDGDLQFALGYDVVSFYVEANA
ncbi:hypothetical protein [Azonexus sp.]|jgi:hypothetical protein|uniref:hypothetical protein n=1 Tax=Azonexus sp. TaxID=1872668 RepID=UPI002824A61A|nr:hypothetical protein [Azonexus sp.]MDR1996474.1 hypothetical protein [Azonexus sp.]